MRGNGNQRCGVSACGGIPRYEMRATGNNSAIRDWPSARRPPHRLFERDYAISHSNTAISGGAQKRSGTIVSPIPRDT